MIVICPPSRVRSPIFAVLWVVLLSLASCSRGPTNEQAVNEAYTNYRKAIQDGNLEALKQCVSAEKNKEMKGEDSQQKLGLIKQLMPKEVKIVKITIENDKAVLEVQAGMAGQSMNGKVDLVKEAGRWKIFKESWEMKLDFSTLAGTVGAAAAVEPFLKDPQQPPTAHRILKGHQDAVSRLVFTPDGKYLISASYGDYSLRVWDVDDGAEKAGYKSDNRISCLDVTRDGKLVVIGDAYNHIATCPLEVLLQGDLEKSRRAARLIVKDAGDEFALSPDNKLIAVTGYQKPVVIFNFSDGSEVTKLPATEKERKLVFSPSGKLLATAGKGNTISLWDVKNWKATHHTLNKVQKDMDIGALHFSPDEKHLAIGCMDSSIVVFDIQKKKELHNFFVSQSSTWDIKFSPDGNFFATAQQDKTVYVWDTRTARQLAALKKHGDSPQCLAFSPDGRTLASGAQDRIIIFWRSGAPPQPVVEETDKAAGIVLPELKEPEATDLFGRKNLLPNPNATRGVKSWQTKGEATIEERSPGNPCFVVRHNGMFWQDAPIPVATTNQHALLIGRVSSERINADGDITGLPYLYGCLVDAKDDHHFHGYLQGDTMRCATTNKNEWTPVWGIFKMTNHTASIRFFLQQASGHDAQTGTAARFDDLGVFLFDAEADANAFVEKYRQVGAKSAESPPPANTETTGVAQLSPADQAASKPAPQGIPSSAFKITGVMGQIGTADVTITINGKLFVKVDETFDFQYQGKTYSLKLLSVSENEVKIQNQEETIVVRWSLEDI